MTEDGVIQGRLTRVRPLAERDLANLVEWRNRHRLRFADSSLITLEGQADWYADYLRRDDDLMYIFETSEGRPIGCLSLYHIDRAARISEGGRIMIGRPEDEGRGYAIDACRAVLDHARKALGLDLVYVRIRADNQKVIPLYRRLGFVPDPSRDSTVDDNGAQVRLTGMTVHLSPDAVPAAGMSPAPDPPISVVVVRPGITPSTHIRLLSPLAWLVERAYVTYTMIPDNDLLPPRRQIPRLALHRSLPRREARRRAERSLRDADVVVFQRVTSPAGVRAQARARAAGAAVIYESDDNFLATDKDTPARYLNPSVRRSFVKLLSGAQVVTTTTEVLAAAFREFAADVRVLPSCVDFTHIDTHPRPEAPSALVIGYAGTVTHGHDFECVEPALRRILEESGDTVRMQFFGFAPKSLVGLPNVDFVPYDTDYPAFLRALSRVDWSFGIAPLASLPSKAGKSNNKYREYGACRIPAIYSDCPSYSRCVIDGKTGLLVPHTEEGWYAGLRRMMADASLRESLANAAYDDVVEHYSVATAAQALLGTYRDVLSRARR